MAWTERSSSASCHTSAQALSDAALSSMRRSFYGAITALYRVIGGLCRQAKPAGERSLTRGGSRAGRVGRMAPERVAKAGQAIEGKGLQQQQGHPRQDDRQLMEVGHQPQ